MKRIAIIMAGGSGERFWPLSRKRKPKQLLSLESDNTMLEDSIERISRIIPPEDIYIITGSLIIESIRKTVPQIPPENIIGEPAKRNTAPCLALAAAFIKAKYANQFESSEISVAVLTADQSIKPIDEFAKTVTSALDYIENNDVIATIGIIPSRVETGYGYIEVAPIVNKSNESNILSVKRFHEKPSSDTAQQYLESKRFLWNSGMFFWRLDIFESQMKKHLPVIGDKIEAMYRKSIGQTDKPLNSSFVYVSDIFCSFPDISIDYGLMEKADNVVVVTATFDWDDIGSWDSLDRIRPKDHLGNIVDGIAALHDVTNSIVVNQSSKNEILVAGIGLNNFVIVVTDDAVLVCPKDRVQEVKKSVEIIKQNNNDKWL